MKRLLNIRFPLKLSNLIGTAAKDGKDGKTPTAAEIEAAARKVLADNPPAAGQNATYAQIMDVVAAYMTTHPAPKGDKGDPGAGTLVSLGEIKLEQTAVLALGPGIRTITLTGIAGLRKGEVVLAVPTAGLPVGYAIHSAYATADGTLQVQLTSPALALGANYSITAKLVAFR
jgi:hypothetical protein